MSDVEAEAGVEETKGSEPVTDSPTAEEGSGAGAGAGGEEEEEVELPSGIFKVTKTIYIGASKAVHAALQEEGVVEALGATDIINVSADDVPTPDEVRMNMELTTVDVALANNPGAKLGPACKTAFTAMLKAIKRGGKVVLHCADGASRSPAILIAFLIKVKKLNFDQALEEVQDGLPYRVELNVGFAEQLNLLGSGASASAVAEAAERHSTKPGRSDRRDKGKAKNKRDRDKRRR